MPRHILIRDKSSNSIALLPEAKVGQEELLQQAIKQNPQLIPAADYDLGELLVVDREATAGNGYADLVCLDPSGQIVIVEMKRGPENPDSRRVVAQVLEYGAHFWQMTAEEFERRALEFFRSSQCESARLKQVHSLQEAFELPEETGPGVCEGESIGDGFDILESIQENLTQGRFVYLIISTRIDAPLRRVMEYLNSTASFRIGAVEIDYFTDGEQELFVPRSIAPAGSPKRATQGSRTDRETFLGSVIPGTEQFFEDLLGGLAELGFTIVWGTRGCSCRLRVGERYVTFLCCYPSTVWWLKNKQASQIDITTRAPDHMPELEPAIKAWAAKSTEIGEWKDGKNTSSLYIGNSAPEELLESLLDAAREAAETIGRQ